MIDDNLKLTPFHLEDLEVAYNSFKTELYTVIDKVFGWDESFQLNRFQNQYKREWFHWIENQFGRVGYICFFQRENDIHVSLLIISSEEQGKGYGKIAMYLIEEIAKRENLKVTLSSFKENAMAVRFYKSLGYKIISQDEHFLDLAL